MIAIAALLSGVFGGRSQAVAQLIQHIIAIIGLLATIVGDKSLSNSDNTDTPTTESSESENHPPLLDSASHLEPQRISLISMTPSVSISPTAAPTARTSQVSNESFRHCSTGSQA